MEETAIKNNVTTTHPRIITKKKSSKKDNFEKNSEIKYVCVECAKFISLANEKLSSLILYICFLFFIFSSLHHQRELYIGARGRSLPTIFFFFQYGERVMIKKFFNNKQREGTGKMHLIQLLRRQGAEGSWWDSVNTRLGLSRFLIFKIIN